MNGTGPVVLSGEQFAEKDIRNFVENAAQLTGAQVKISIQWVLTCDDNPQVLDALRIIFSGAKPVDARLAQKTGGGRGRRRKQVDEKPAELPKPAFVLKPGKPLPVKSWRLLDEQGGTLERLTAAEMERRLAAGEFMPGQKLKHPNLGIQCVDGEKGQPQQLVAA